MRLNNEQSSKNEYSILVIVLVLQSMFSLENVLECKLPFHNAACLPESPFPQKGLFSFFLSYSLPLLIT
jgi:hypothetical protein